MAEGSHILVVGSGGREHALAWRLAQSESVERVTVAPGNPGMARTSGVVPLGTEVEPADLGAPDGLAPLGPSRTNGAGEGNQPVGTPVDLVVFGPEVPLAAGAADRFRAAGYPVIGPGADAARLESSKTFAKEFMERSGVPTARSMTCHLPEEARSAVRELVAATGTADPAGSVPIVIKADGLAAGKGVLICATPEEADGSIDHIMVQRAFGDAGSRVVVEEYLSGPEASLILLTDGSDYLLFPTARDHKRIGEGDTGPNTGGMGVIAPNPDVTEEIAQETIDRIVEPTMEGIRTAGWDYRGFLFIGLMLTPDGPKVLEYNVRFGDPEAQAILPLLQGDLGLLLQAAAAGRLGVRGDRRTTTTGRSGTAGSDRTAPDGMSPSVDGNQTAGAACTVVAAAPGYPDRYPKGLAIDDWGGSEGVVFYAGVADPEGFSTESSQLVTSGGRVLSVTGVGRDLPAARRVAYRRLAAIQFAGMYYRRDIGGAPITSHIVEESEHLLPQFAKREGLLPVVVQDADTRDVLMVGYANADALRATLERGTPTFWSTSRNSLWVKGETSGNTLELVEVRIDCDQDALLYLVRLQGEGICHTKNAAGRARRRCFYRTVRSGTHSLEFDGGEM